MKSIRTLVLLPMMLLMLIGCSTPPSPAMVTVGASYATYKTLQLTDTSRENAEKSGEIAGTVSIWITANGEASEEQIDAELNRLVEEQFPNVEDREAVLAIKDLAKEAVIAAIEQHGLQLGDRAKLVLIYVKATADGVKQGVVRYIKYLDSRPAAARLWLWKGRVVSIADDP